jgi:hypothetical protein
MTIVYLKRLQDFEKKHANARNYLSDWKNGSQKHNGRRNKMYWMNFQTPI